MFRQTSDLWKVQNSVFSHACLSCCIFLGRRILIVLTLLISQLPVPVIMLVGLLFLFSRHRAPWQWPKSVTPGAPDWACRTFRICVQFDLVLSLSPSQETWVDVVYQVKLVTFISRGLESWVHNISPRKTYTISWLFNGLHRLQALQLRP